MTISTRSDELLDAALSEFIEQGYAPTGVKEITSRADVSHGTFYNYFQNRRQMLAILVERELADFIRVLTAAVGGLDRPVTEDSLRATMESVTLELFDLVTRRAEALTFILVDVPGIDQAALTSHLRTFRDLGALASEIFAAAADDGIVDERIDLEFAGQAWMSYVLAAVAPVVVDTRSIDEPARTAATVVAFLLHGSPTSADRC